MNDQSMKRSQRLLPLVAATLLLAMALIAALTAPALAQDGDAEDQESPFATNVVTTTTTANVNLRQQPGLTAEIIQVVPAGTVVGFTGFMDGSGAWAQVDPVGAPVGWMHVSLLASVPDGLQVRPADLPEDETDQPEDEADQPEDEEEVDFSGDVVTGQTQANVYLRSSPSQSFNIIETLPAGTVVGYTGFTDGSGNWVQVDPVGAPVGWVWGAYLTNVPPNLQVRPADLPDEETSEEGPTPAVTVRDQALDGGNTVTIAEVVAAEAGWMVIHASDEGAPGPVIGHAAVASGANENVTVDIDADAATATLFAMLHVDGGEMGVYEFPGADGPVRVDGSVVVRPFTLTDFEQESPFADTVVTTATTIDGNLREGPGLDMAIIQVVPQGTIVGFTGFTDATGLWVQVDPVGAPVGWMHVSLLASVPDGLQVADLAMDNGG